MLCGITRHRPEQGRAPTHPWVRGHLNQDAGHSVYFEAACPMSHFEIMTRASHLPRQGPRSAGSIPIAMKLRSIVSTAVLGFALTASAGAAAAEHTLRIATIAPKASSWGKVYGAWQKAVEKKTEGKLELQVYYNGVQGNEDAMVSKIKTGQLDGAAITAVGLSLIYKSVLVLQLPGVLTTWEQLDKVRAQLQPTLDAGIK